MSVSSYMDGTMQDYRRLLYEAQVYLNLKATGQLPKPIYEMPIDVMLTIFALQREFDGGDPQPPEAPGGDPATFPW